MATNNDKEMQRLAKKLNKHYSKKVSMKIKKEKTLNKENKDFIGNKKEKLNREAVVTVVGFYGVLFGVAYILIVATVLIADLILLNNTAKKETKIINDNAIKCVDMQLENLEMFNEKLDNDVDLYLNDTKTFSSFVREKLVSRKDLSSLYIEEDGDISSINKYSKEKVITGSDIYKVINDFINSDKQNDISGFVYDINKSNFVKLIMRKIYKDNQYIGTVALCYDLTLESDGIIKYLDTVKDLNCFILDQDQNIIYKSNRLNDVTNKIFTNTNENKKIKYNKDLLTNKKEKNTVDDGSDQPLFGYGKNKDKDNKYASSKNIEDQAEPLYQSGKEKYSGVLETIGGQTFENIDNVESSGRLTKYTFAKSEKGDLTIVIEYSEFLSNQIRVYIFVCTIILVLVLICSYIYSMNSPDTLNNVKILGGFFVLFILVEAVTLAIAYTSIHMNIKNKRGLSESLLLEKYLGTQYDINVLIDSRTNEIYKNQTFTDEDLYNVRNNIENDIVNIYKLSNDSNVEILVGVENSNNDSIRLQYENTKKMLVEGTRNYCIVNQDETRIRTTKLYDITYPNASIIYEISLDLGSQNLLLENLGNDTMKVYIEDGDTTYYIGDKIEEESLNNKIKYKKINDNMYATSRGNRIYTKYHDNNLDITYVFVSIANKTFVESLMDIVVELIWAISILWVVFTSIKAKIVEVVDNVNNSKIYGDIVYMKQDELERVVQIKEEREKIKEEEKIALDESYKNFLIRKKKLNVSFKDEEENEQITFGNKNKQVDTNKRLDIFKNDKKIFTNYSEVLKKEAEMAAKSMQQMAQMQQEMYARMKPAEDNEENEDENINHDITLGEALTLFEKKKKKQKDDDQNKDKLYDKNSKELLSSSKDEEFGKILAQRYKDTKK